MISYGGGRIGTTQNVAYTSTAGTVTNGVATGVTRIRVVATSDAFLEIGSDPTATNSGVFIPANTPEYFIITPGHKVSAIQSSAGGTLYVTEMV